MGFAPNSVDVVPGMLIGGFCGVDGLRIVLGLDMGAVACVR